MTMTGAGWPRMRIVASSSGRFIADICTSVITQDVSFKWDDAKTPRPPKAAHGIATRPQEVFQCSADRCIIIIDDRYH
jgi:hypothetical protein